MARRSRLEASINDAKEIIARAKPVKAAPMCPDPGPSSSPKTPDLS